MRLYTRIWTVRPPLVSLTQWTDSQTIGNSVGAENLEVVVHGSSLNVFESPSACSPDDAWATVMFLLEVTAMPAFQDVIVVVYDNDGDFIAPLAGNAHHHTEQGDDNCTIPDDSDYVDDDDYESSNQLTIYTYIQGGRIHYVPGQGFRSCVQLLKLSRNPYAFLNDTVQEKINKRLGCLRYSVLAPLKDREEAAVGDDSDADPTASNKSAADCSRFFGFSMIKATVTRDVANLFRIAPHLSSMAIHAALLDPADADNYSRRNNNFHRGLGNKQRTGKSAKSDKEHDEVIRHFARKSHRPTDDDGGVHNNGLKIVLDNGSSEGILAEIPIPNIQLVRILSGDSHRRLPCQFLLSNWGFPVVDADGNKIGVDERDTHNPQNEEAGVLYSRAQLLDSRVIGSKLSYGLYLLCESYLPTASLVYWDAQFLAPLSSTRLAQIDETIKEWVVQNGTAEQFVPFQRLVNDEIAESTDSAYIKILQFEGLNELRSQLERYLGTWIISKRIEMLLANCHSDFARLSDRRLLFHDSRGGSFCLNRTGLVQMMFHLLLQSCDDSVPGDIAPSSTFRRKAYFSTELNLAANCHDMKNILDVISGGEGSDLLRILGLEDDSNDYPGGMESNIERKILPWSRWENYFSHCEMDNEDSKSSTSDAEEDIDSFVKAFEDLALGDLIRSDIKREADEVNNSLTEEEHDNEEATSSISGAEEEVEQDFLNKLNADVREDLFERPEEEIWASGIMGSLAAAAATSTKNMVGGMISPARLVTEDIIRSNEAEGRRKN